jgi:hypothetical protein
LYRSNIPELAAIIFDYCSLMKSLEAIRIIASRIRNFICKTSFSYLNWTFNMSNAYQFVAKFHVYHC